MKDCMLVALEIIFDGQWRMVGETRFSVNTGRANQGLQPGADNLVVDTPADVLGIGCAAV